MHQISSWATTYLWAQYTKPRYSQDWGDRQEDRQFNWWTIKKISVIAHLFTIFSFPFTLPLPPLYPTSSPSFRFHTLTTNDKTIEHDNIGTWWPSNTWWPKELPYRTLSRPRNTQRLVPHRPLPRRDPSPHQAGDSREESPLKPMPPLPAWAQSSPEPATTNSTSPAKGRRSCNNDR